MPQTDEFIENPLTPEIFQVASDADQVSCDGGGGGLGHPIVWYSFDGNPSVTCGYCGRRFVKRIS